MSLRDRRGRPRCVRCPDDDGISDPLTAITQAVKTVDAHLGDAVIVAAVHVALPDRRHHRKLARALVDNPRLLTRAGHLAPVPSVLRLIDPSWTAAPPASSAPPVVGATAWSG